MNIWQKLLTWAGIKKQDTQWVATPEIEAAVQKGETAINNVEAAITLAEPELQALAAAVPEIAPEINIILGAFATAKGTFSTVETVVNAGISAATGKPFPATS